MLISRIQDELREYPSLTVRMGKGQLEIIPQTDAGFSVWVSETPSHFTVGFEGWHEQFSDLDEALNCFFFGLSSSCRLRVSRRGDVDYKWQVLHQVDGRWVVDGEVGFLFFPFWRKKETRELQNDLVKPR